MKQIWPILILLGFLGCTSPEVNMNQTIMLNRKHPEPGRHCESSALRNALLYQGYSFSEAQIVGGGGAMGFLYSNEGFPFLGGRSLTMRDVFLESAGISWEEGDNSTPTASWQGVEQQLQRDVPLVLKVDMRYLPYLFGGKYGSRYSSFGWHMITLYGIDIEKRLAFVSDTDRNGLQSISFRDLKKARSSPLKVLAPERAYYWVEEKPESYTTDWEDMLDRSVEEWLKNYRYVSQNDSELAGLQGQKDFPDTIRRFQQDIKPFLLAQAMIQLHGWIELYGTGGASFRQFTLEYLQEMEIQTGDPRLNEGINLLEQSVLAWHNLSASFLTAGKAMKEDRSPENRQILLEESAKLAEILYTKEEAFYRYLEANWEE